MLVKEGDLLAGKYHIEYLLGKGSFATVWAARNTMIDRMVALKILNDRSIQKPVIMERFFREAKLAARPIHPVLVSVEDMGQTPGGSPFLVMELLKGHTVAEAIKANGAFSWLTSIEIGRLFIEGLAAAHDQKIIHRDIKPANVFLVDPSSSQGPLVRLLDLGLARDMADSKRLTRTGQVMGTANYLPPEALLDRQPKGGTKTGDVFACGMVLFAMLTSRLPFEPSDRPSSPAAEVAIKAELYASGEPLPSPAEFDPTIPEPIDAIVRHALAIDPADRYPTAREMLADLLAAGQRVAPTTPNIEFDDLSKTLKWLPGRSTGLPPTPPLGLALPSPSTSPEDQVKEADGLPTPCATPDEEIRRSATPVTWTASSADLSWKPNPLRWLAIASGSLLVAAVMAGLVVAVLSLTHRAEPDEEVSASIGEPAPPSQIALGADEKDLVHILLQGLPEGAEVTLDGHPISGALLASPVGMRRVLEIRSAGAQPLRLDLSFDGDRTLDLNGRFLPANSETESGSPETSATGEPREPPSHEAETPPLEATATKAPRPRFGGRERDAGRHGPPQKRTSGGINPGGVIDPWAQ
jgi:serine/threonine protein kinase